MTGLLNLTPEQETRLREQAIAQGRPVDQYARELFDDALSSRINVLRSFHKTAMTEEWLAAFDAWVYSHDPNGPV